MTHWLHKLGISREQFYEWCGMHRPIEWHEKNPSWSLRAFVGLLLEEYPLADSRDASTIVLRGAVELSVGASLEPASAAL
jgi:hypothetical protein